jgi:multiple sugar transport system ATP-binding protein
MRCKNGKRPLRFPPVAAIELEGLTKIYGDGTRAVHELDLQIEDGEFVVFVGPSGCGKTSALRMIAGLEEISGGTVRVGGEVVNDLPPKHRDIAMIFQNYALYPHMDVYDNMGFGLKMRGLDRGEIRRRVEDAARILGLSEVLRKKPRHLSGGQRQRVAMGRAIVREPQAFLMDEPLSNLDAKLRVHMRAEIARIQRDLRVTTIYVTHDQSEAMTLGDRVCVLRGGLLQQVDRPQVLYDRPANLFVAGFIGSPAMNLVEAELAEGDGGLTATFGLHALDVPAGVVAARPGLRHYLGRRVALGIRPEDVEDPLASGPVAPGARLDVTVDIKEDMGSEVYLHFAVHAPSVKADELREIVGDEALEAADEQTHHGTPFIARVVRGTQAREGEPVQLAVVTERLHFFDLETGDGIYDGGAVEPVLDAAATSASRA